MQKHGLEYRPSEAERVGREISRNVVKMFTIMMTRGSASQLPMSQTWTQWSGCNYHVYVVLYCFNVDYSHDQSRLWDYDPGSKESTDTDWQTNTRSHTLTHLITGTSVSITSRKSSRSSRFSFLEEEMSFLNIKFLMIQ